MIVWNIQNVRVATDLGGGSRKIARVKHIGSSAIVVADQERGNNGLARNIR